MNQYRKFTAMLKLTHNRLLIVIGIFVLAGALFAMLSGGKAAALNNTYPDTVHDTSFTGQPGNVNAQIIMSDVGQLNAPTSEVAVYTTDPKASFYIEGGANDCGNSDSGNVTVRWSFITDTKTSGWVVTKVVQSARQGAVGGANTDNSCLPYLVTLTLPPDSTGSKQIGDRWYYVWRVQTNLVASSGGLNAFHYLVNENLLPGAPAGIIAPFSLGVYNSDYANYGVNDQEVPLKNRGILACLPGAKLPPCTNSGVYRLKFAPPCNQAWDGRTQRAYLQWFDDDYGSPEEPPSSPIRLQLLDETTGALVPLTHYLPATPAGTATTIAADAGNQIPGAAYFFPQTEHKYTWIVSNVHPNNGWEFRQPFDGINHETNCQHISCTVTGPATVFPNSSYTAVVHVKNSGKGGLDTRFGVTDSATPLSQTNISPTIPPGGTGNIPIAMTSGTPPGSYTVGFTVYNHIPPLNMPGQVAAQCSLPIQIIPQPKPRFTAAPTATCTLVQFRAQYDPPNNNIPLKVHLQISDLSNGSVVVDNPNWVIPPPYSAAAEQFDPFGNLPGTATKIYPHKTYSVTLSLFDPSGAPVAGSDNTVNINGGQPCITPSCSISGNPEPGEVSQGISYKVDNNTDQTYNQPNYFFTFDVSPGPLPVDVPAGPPFPRSSNPVQPTLPPFGSAGLTVNATLNHILGGSLAVTPCRITASTRPYLKVFGDNAAAGGDWQNVSPGKCDKASSNINTYGRFTIPGVAGPPSGGYGSTGEFAALASGSIFGSLTDESPPMAAFYSGINRNIVVPPDASLNFSNTGPFAAGIFGGKFGQTSCFVDYFAGYTNAVKAGAPTITGDLPGNPANGNYYFNNGGSGPVNIGGLDLKEGQQITVYVNGDVTISGDITFNPGSGYSPKTNDWPYFKLVVMGNIYVKDSVTKLAGFYIAQPQNDGSAGRFYDCANGTTPVSLSSMTLNDCFNQLTINGALLAQRLAPGRTGVSSTLKASTLSDTDLANRFNKEPTEVFSLTPEIIVGTPFTSGGSGCGNICLDSISSLPPTF